jgi:creatinine amidohydrolase/Fe(II)-dependent formamide hydrolase-like protein
MEMVLMAAAVGLKAHSQVEQGKMQAMSYRLQASQAELQGRQNALNYSRQGLQVLRRQEQLAATVRARASAGGIDAFTGSPLTIQQVDMMKAQEEAQIAQENAQSAIYGSLAQSQSLQAAAGAARYMGNLGALTTLVSGAAMYGQTATPATPNMNIPVRDIPVGG